MTTITWIYLGLLWILFFWMYRSYRLDAFRQELFAIRDELFDLASAGEIGFDDRVYQMLRGSLNWNIQFGHKTGFLDLVCHYIFVGKNEYEDAQVSKYCEAWKTAVESLTPESRKKVEALRSRSHVAVFKQIIFTSAILMFSLFLVVAALLFYVLRSSVKKMICWLFSTRNIRRMFDTYDCAGASA